jgi:HlyD family secretion protein
MESQPNKPDLSLLKIDKSKKFGDRPKSKKWLILVWLAAAVAIVVGYFQFRERVAPATKVRTATVSLLSGSDAQAALVATGYVVAQRKAEVASKGTGRLERLDFEEGDSVRSGQVIAELDNSDIKANLMLANANLQRAAADSLNAGRQFRRFKDLLTSGSINQIQFESAESAFQMAIASVNAAEASVRVAEVALENTFIRAPFDGTILTKNADVGEIVAPFASSASSKGSVVTLADMGSLEVEADVSESNINKVVVGQLCEIVLDAYPETRYKARVKKIVPTADRARATVLTKVAFLEKDSRVLPEMSARVNFFSDTSQTRTVGTMLAVPKDCVTSRESVTVCFRVNGEFVEQRTIQKGRELGSMTEILSGLSQGDRVVLSPPGKMTDGQKIEMSQ